MDNSQHTVTISKEELAGLPAAEYEGKITVIDTAEEIDAALAELRRSDIIGIDTETKPSFKRGQSHKVALLQLSSDTHCYLFRINKTGLTKSLVDFLEDGEVLKIGLSLHDDFNNLNKLCKLNAQGCVDLQQYVKPFNIADNSLSKIYAVVFGKRISKGQRLSNWEAAELTQAQQHYAALDALACVRIYRALQEGAFVAENSPYYKMIETHEE